MVDFQSRDTSRGYGSTADEDDEDEQDELNDEEATESSDPLDGAIEADSESTTERSGSGTVEEHAGETEGASESEDLDFEHEESHADEESHAHDAGNTHEETHTHEGSHAHGHGAIGEAVGVAVVTISSTRDIENDPSGDVVESLIEAADHEVATRDLVRDDLDGIQNAVTALVDRSDVDAIVTTGGTGITPDDVTVEAVEPLFDKHLPGFGELFRLLSHEEIGTRAMASRATAGVVDGVVVFCLPGSEDAAHLGTEQLVTEELAHLVGLARGE